MHKGNLMIVCPSNLKNEGLAVCTNSGVENLDNIKLGWHLEFSINIKNIYI
jgi:hypothetical protein